MNIGSGRNSLSTWFRSKQVTLCFLSTKSHPLFAHTDLSFAQTEHKQKMNTGAKLHMGTGHITSLHSCSNAKCSSFSLPWLMANWGSEVLTTCCGHTAVKTVVSCLLRFLPVAHCMWDLEVPWPEIEPETLAVKRLSPNHQTARNS